MSKDPFIEGIHYYLQDGKIIFTSLYLASRKECCGSKCRHCPYTESVKGNKNIKEEFQILNKTK